MSKITSGGIYTFLVCGLLFLQNIYAQCPDVTNQNQVFCDTQEATVADLAATDNGGGVQWYAAATDTTPISEDTFLENGLVYYADDASGTCGTRESVTVTIYSEPSGLSFQGFCVTSMGTGEIPTLADLVISGENIQWYNTEFDGEALPDTTILVDQEVYYASQTPSGTNCETSRLAVQVSVSDVSSAPSGAEEQYFCGSENNPPTISDLVASGENNWYLSPAGNIPLSADTELVDGETYYGTLVAPPCESTERLPVTVTIQPVNEAGEDAARTICINDVDVVGSINLYNELGGLPDAGGQWTGPATVVGGMLEVSSLSVGVYEFTYTVQNSDYCPADTAIVTIEITENLDAGESGEVEFCAADPGVDLLSYIGGTPNLGGQWSPALASGTGFFDPSVDAGGVYTYTINGSGGCDMSTSTVTVVVDQEPNSGIFTGVQDICSSQGTFDLYDLLDGNQDLTGTWLDSNGDQVSNVIDVTTLDEGSHSYNYVVINNCGTESTSVSFQLYDSLSAGEFTGMQTFCVSTNTVDLFSLLTNEDTGGEWTNDSGATITNPIDLSGVAVGEYSYTYTVTSATCGTSEEEVTIAVVNVLNAGAFTGTQDICITDTDFNLFTLLDGTEDAGGVWTNASDEVIDEILTSETMEVGNNYYTYTVSSEGCTAVSTEVNVNVIALPSSGNFTGEVSYCMSDGMPDELDLFTLLDGSETEGGEWTNDAGTTIANPIDLTTASQETYTYTYTVTSTVCGTFSTDVSFVIQDEAPNAGVFTGPVSLCPYNSPFNLFNLLDGTQDADGIWTDEDGVEVGNSINIMTFSDGEYHYTYTVTTSCGTTSTEVYFVIPSSFNPGASTSVTFCEAASGEDLFNYLGGTPDEGGIWTPALASGTGYFDPAVDEAGVYYYSSALTVGGCFQASSSIVVSISETPETGNFTGIQSYCIASLPNDPIDLFDFLDGTQEEGGVWTDYSGAEVSNTVDLTELTVGTYTYAYAIWNTDCGTYFTGVTFEIVPMPEPGTFTGEETYCLNIPSNFPIDLFDLLENETSGGVWTDASGTTISNQLTLADVTEGNHTYTYTVSNDACGEVGVDVSIQIQDGAPSAGEFTGVISVCPYYSPFDLTNLLDGSQSSGGEWTDAEGNVVSNPLDITMYGQGVYSFNYTVSSECGTDTETVSFMIPAVFNPGASTSITFCSSDDGADLFQVLGGTPDAGGIWTPALASGTGYFDPAVDAAGVYYYSSALTTGGCFQASSSVVVNVINGPSSGDFTGGVTYCTEALPSTLDLFDFLENETMGGVWTDANGATTSNAIDVTGFTAGTYTYTYTVTSDSCGDVSTNVVFAVEEDAPSAGLFTGIISLCPYYSPFDLTNLLDGTQSIGGEWTDAEGNVVSNSLDISTYTQGTYTFTYTVSNECGTDSETVIFVIPATFNPGASTIISFCNTDEGSDLYDALGGTPDSGGIWTPALASGTGYFDPAVDAPGVYYYSSALTTGGCFQASSSVVVNVHEGPSAGDFTGIVSYCTTALPDTVDLFDFLENESEGGTWTDSSGTTVTNTIDVSDFATGTYTYNYTVTSDVCGDVSTAVSFVIESGAPSAGDFTGIISVCPYYSPLDLHDLLDGSQTLGGEWTDAEGIVVDNPLDISMYGQGTYTFTYTVTNECGTDTETVTFVIPATFNPGASTIVSFCNTDEGSDLFDALGGTPDTGGIWTPALASGTGYFDPAVDAPGVYYYSSALTTGGCFQASSSVVVNVNEGPYPGDDTGGVTYCTAALPSSVDLFDLLENESEGGVWTNANGDTTTNPIDVSAFSTGLYTYTYTVSSETCGDVSTTVSILIEDGAPSAGNFTGSVSICPYNGPVDVSTLLDGSQSIGGEWTDADSNVVANLVDISTYTEGTYTFTYTITNECGTDSEEVSFEIPATFNPGESSSIAFCSTDAGSDLFDALGGTPDTDGIWTPALASGTGYFDPSVDTSGVYYYSSAASEDTCDQATASVVVSVNDGLSSGNFTGEVSYCIAALPESVDLYTLLENETVGGVWTDADDNTIANNVDISAFGIGTYNYTYTVTSESCGDFSTGVSFVIETGIPEAGTFTGEQEICTAEGTFDLFDLLDGTQTNGGEWSDENGAVTNPLSLDTMTEGVYTYTYTVSNACGSASETVQLSVIEATPLENVTISANSPLCMGENLTVVIGNLTDGSYIVSYHVEGANTIASETVTTTAIDQQIELIVNSVFLTNTGVSTIIIDDILQQGAACPTSVDDLSADFEINELGTVEESNLTIEDICEGTTATLFIENADIADGTYTFTYTLATLSETNTYTSETVTITAGSGSFEIPVEQLETADTYLLSIEIITDTDAGCTNTSVDASVAFQVVENPQIVEAQTKLFTNDVCVGAANEVEFSNPSVPDGDYVISYELTGAATYTETDVIITIVGGSGFFTIPEGVLMTEGTVQVTLLSFSNNAAMCAVNFTEVITVSFEVIGGIDLPYLVAEGNYFCEQANPMLSDLTANLEEVLGTVVWYDAAEGGNAYTEDVALVNGETYYLTYEENEACPAIDRMAVTVTIDFCDLLIPDGFSPNNDGVNETFTITNLRANYPNYTIEIFNRYGNLVYTGDISKPDWDGRTTTGVFTLGNNGVPTGVYFYVLKLNDGESDPIQGRVYLNR